MNKKCIKVYGFEALKYKIIRRSRAKMAPKTANIPRIKLRIPKAARENRSDPGLFIYNRLYGLAAVAGKKPPRHQPPT